MERAPIYRKRVVHFNEPNIFHFLTFSCYNRLKLLTNNTRLSMLSESIDRATQRHDYLLVAFVYMPEHVHLLVFPERKASPIDHLLRAIKRPFSYRVKQVLIESSSPLLKKLTVHQRPGVRTFRFWQEGPGYDKNLISLRTASATVDYIHLNPVRRGLVENETDWKWSSARLYAYPSADPDVGLPALTMLSEDLYT